MKKFIQTNAFIMLSALSTSALTASFDVDINNDTLRGEYHLSDPQADLGLSGAILLTDDNGEVFAVTAHTQGALANQEAIRGGFGGRLYHGSPDQGDSFQALGIGGFVEVTIPELQDLIVGLEFIYAPSITITDDLDNLTELNLRVSYQLFENAAAYVGIRHLEVEQDDVDFEITEDAHIGFTIQF